MGTQIEYRVRPVTRYIVTRYERAGDGSGSCIQKGEFANDELAGEIARALSAGEPGSFCTSDISNQPEGFTNGS